MHYKDLGLVIIDEEQRFGVEHKEALKKLRVKFIALNMATVAVVLAVVFTAICVIDYQQSVARVH